MVVFNFSSSPSENFTVQYLGDNPEAVRQARPCLKQHSSGGRSMGHAGAVGCHVR